MRRLLFYVLLLCLACSVWACASTDDKPAGDAPAGAAASAIPQTDIQAIEGADNQLSQQQTALLQLPEVRSGAARHWHLERYDSALVALTDSLRVEKDGTLRLYHVFEAKQPGTAHIHYELIDTMRVDSTLEEDTTANFYLQIVEAQTPS